MLTLYKRGRKFWARGSVHGRSIRVSLDTQFKEVAFQRMIHLELHGGRKAVKWMEFRKTFLDWKKLSAAESTQRKYDFVLWRFGKFLEGRNIPMLSDITPGLIADYCTARQLDKHPNSGKGVGPPGIKSDLRILHGVLAYAVKCGHLDTNPIASSGLNTSGGNTLPFAQQDIDLMMSCEYVRNNPFRSAVLLTFLYTGLRISDVSGMKKTAVNFEEGRIFLVTAKRKKPVALSLHADLRAALKEHLRKLNDSQRFSPYLFPTRTGRRLYTQSMDAHLRRMFAHAGIEKGHAHRFRDTFAVRLLEHGASLYDVSKLLGITMRVAEAHYSPWVKELQDRARRLIDLLDFERITSEVQGFGNR